MMQDEDSEEPISDRDAFIVLQRIDNSSGFKQLQMAQGKNNSLVKKAKTKYPHLYSFAMENLGEDYPKVYTEETGPLLDEALHSNLQIAAKEEKKKNDNYNLIISKIFNEIKPLQKRTNHDRNQHYNPDLEGLDAVPLEFLNTMPAVSPDMNQDYPLFVAQTG